MKKEPGTPQRRRLDAPALFEYALRALAGRAHSIGELRQKLELRAAEKADIPAVLARLKERGFLDDRQFAESFSEARLENEGFGKRRVLADLRKRRVAPALAERAVEKAYRGADETQLIEEFLARKFRHADLAALLADPKRLASAWRRLRAAGFSPAGSLDVLKRFARDPELLDHWAEAEESQ